MRVACAIHLRGMRNTWVVGLVVLGLVNVARAQGAPSDTAPATATSDGLAPSPFGDSELHAGSWPVELYMPWEGTFAADNVWIGMVGVGVGLGNRITPNWYLGVTADYELLAGIEGGDDGTVPDLNRLRGGVETRYIINRGTSVASVNCGPAFHLPRYDWIGARAGVETLDGGTTHGEYGELSIGSAFALGRTQLGMYLAAGLSVEPIQAYGLTSPPSDTTAKTVTPPDNSPSAIGKYVTLGMLVSLG
jgi:hypothetical protein